MAKCIICSSNSFLVYALNPISFNTTIMCETCYAKSYFAGEYPNLSKLSLEHIRLLPHVSNASPYMNQISPSITGISSMSGLPSNGILDWPFNSNITTIPANPFSGGGFGRPDNTKNRGNEKDIIARIKKSKELVSPITGRPFWEESQPSTNPVINSLPHTTFASDRGFNSSATNKLTNATSSSNSTSNSASNSASNSSSAYNPELAKKLNEFIKRTLFPDMMDLPDPTPKSKHPHVDTDEETMTEEEHEDLPFEWIGGDVKNIRDLIRLGKEYKEHPKRVQTNLDLVKLGRLVEPLETLQNMVGLEDIKDSIFKQVVFHLQDLDNGNKDMHHTVIKGPPGVGKTQISHIIAKIYKGLGFLKKDTVVSVKRDDLIAGYLGQTAMKAKKKYEEALGGVLLIDEAYALGDGSDKDSYSKEAIDLLTSYLSEHGHEFICIIAGYKEALEKRFFSVNEGLARRFNIHYDIKPYSGTDICQIFQKLVSDGGWQLDASAYAPEFFTKNIDSFPHFGGDMLNLFAYTKKAHSTRLLAIRTKEQLINTKKKINMADLEAGFEQYKLGNGYATKDTPFEAKFMYM